MRFYHALADVELQESVHFFRLAALQIRRELIDLSLHCDGALGLSNNHATQRSEVKDESHSPDKYDAKDSTYDPCKVAQWAEFHQAIANLPEQERDVRMTIKYTHIGLDDQAEAVKKLPWNSDSGQTAMKNEVGSWQRYGSGK